MLYPQPYVIMNCVVNRLRCWLFSKNKGGEVGHLLEMGEVGHLLEIGQQGGDSGDIGGLK